MARALGNWCTARQLMNGSWKNMSEKCDDPELLPVSDIYAYGDVTEIREERKNWPDCLLTKKIWVFEKSRWHPFDE